MSLSKVINSSKAWWVFGLVGALLGLLSNWYWLVVNGYEESIGGGGGKLMGFLGFGLGMIVWLIIQEFTKKKTK